MQFIKDHSSKTIKAATVARHVGLSRGMLDIRFRRAIGRSVYGEISRVRLGKATMPFFKSSLLDGRRSARKPIGRVSQAPRI